MKKNHIEFKWIKFTASEEDQRDPFFKDLISYPIGVAFEGVKIQ